MNLFGFEIKWNGQNKYVCRDDCHTAMNSINLRIEDLKDHIDTRIDDLKCYIQKNNK